MHENGVKMLEKCFVNYSNIRNRKESALDCHNFTKKITTTKFDAADSLSNQLYRTIQNIVAFNNWCLVHGLTALEVLAGSVLIKIQVIVTGFFPFYIWHQSQTDSSTIRSDIINGKWLARWWFNGFIECTVTICIKVISVFVLLKTTEIDWHIRKCCNFCITACRKKMRGQARLRFALVRSEMMKIALSIAVQLQIQLTVELHAKSIWNNIR